jgi:hypothetical protein
MHKGTYPSVSSPKSFDATHGCFGCFFTSHNSLFEGLGKNVPFLKKPKLC